jgi:CRP-like cAMP-binding protein
MTKRRVRSGEVLFRKGDDATMMYVVLEGRLHLEETNMDVMPGAVVGELGMLAPDGKRTQTLVCQNGGEIVEISYARIEEIYFQNPTFGFYFLRLSAARLFENLARLEQTLAARDKELQQLRAALPSLISRRSASPPAE